MIKKLISTIFTIILMVLVTTLSSVLVVRTMLYKNTINDMINIFVTNDNKTINTEDINVKNKSNTGIVEDLFEEVLDETTIPSELIDYLETEEVSKYINNYISQFMEYNIGMSELPTLNTKEFNELIDTAVKDYEKKTGNDINEEELSNIIISIDETVSNAELPDNKYVQTGRKVLRVCFDNRTLFILGALIVLSILIILLIKGIRSTFKRISIILIINSIILTAMSLALTFLGINEIVNTLLKIMINNLNTFAYTSFGIGVVIYILLTLIKPRKPKLVIEVPAIEVKEEKEIKEEPKKEETKEEVVVEEKVEAKKEEETPKKAPAKKKTTSKKTTTKKTTTKKTPAKKKTTSKKETQKK